MCLQCWHWHQKSPNAEQWKMGARTGCHSPFLYYCPGNWENLTEDFCWKKYYFRKEDTVKEKYIILEKFRIHPGQVCIQETQHLLRKDVKIKQFLSGQWKTRWELRRFNWCKHLQRRRIGTLVGLHFFFQGGGGKEFVWPSFCLPCPTFAPSEFPWQWTRLIYSFQGWVHENIIIIYYYRRSIGEDLLETYQRPTWLIWDRHAWLETIMPDWRPTYLIGDQHAWSETYWRPIGDLNILHRRPNLKPTWPIGDCHAWSTTHWIPTCMYINKQKVYENKYI